MNIADIRAKYPMYSDLSDEQLLKGFHKKYYSDMDFNDFASKLGYNQAAPQEQTNGWDKAQDIADTALGVVGTFDKGYSLGWGKKLGGALNAIGAAPVDAIVTGKPLIEAVKERYNEIVEPTKQASDKFAEENPMTALGLEVTGGLLSPMNKVAGGFYPSKGGTLAKAGGGMALGGAGGYLYGKGNDIDAADSSAIGAALGGAVPVTGAVVKNVPKAVGYVGQQILGKTTGAGDKAIATAYNAGRTGNTRFLEAMQTPVSLESTVGKANARLNNMMQKRNQAYAEDIQRLRQSTDKIDIMPVIRDVQRTINAEAGGSAYMVDADTARVFDKTKNILNNFFKDKARHNAAGFDDLKKAIRNIKTPAGERAEVVKNQIAKTIEAQIIRQSPQYKKIMDRYARDSAMIDELKRTFSLDVRANPETTLRKMQSVTRNNANTDYGYRETLLKELDPTGEIADALAGSALNSFTPRGLVSSGVGLYGLTSANPFALAASSPRLVGEGTYRLGQAVQKADTSLTNMASKFRNLIPVQRSESQTPVLLDTKKNYTPIKKTDKKDTSLIAFMAKPKRQPVTEIIDENGKKLYLFGEEK